MSYDGTSLTDLNRARAALGDTSNNPATELLTNAEITAVITEDGYSYGVAVLAETLAARYAQKPTQVQLPGGLGVTWGERIDQWNKIAAQYRATAAQAVLEAGLVIPTSASVETRIAW
jgi:hypothetical protein